MGYTSRRCPLCLVNWPLDLSEYARCPECQTPTDGSSEPAMLNAEAKSRKSHAAFERYLDEHDRRDPVELLERIPVKPRAA